MSQPKSLGRAVLDGDIPAIRASMAAQPPSKMRLNRALLNQAIGDPTNEHPEHPPLPRDVRLKVVRFLVEAGADIDNTDGENYMTAMHRAIHENDLELLDLVIELGSRVHLPDNSMPEGVHPFLFAALQGCNMGILDRLLQAGADINQKDWTRENALGYALSSGHYALIDPLMGRGCDLNSHDKQGKTALMNYFTRLPGEVVLHLIERGQDLGAPDDNGMTAIDYARLSPCPAADAIHAYIQARDLQGASPLPQSLIPRTRL